MSRHGRRLRRAVAVLGILEALSGIAIPGNAPLLVSSRHHRQDPAIPPSPPFVSLLPDNLDFGNQVVRRTSAAKTITVKNTGGKSLNIDSVTLGGDNPTAFAITKDTCTGATVDPDRACILEITFTPQKTGGRSARLRLNNNALDSPQRLKLRGNGINSNDVAPF